METSRKKRDYSLTGPEGKLAAERGGCRLVSDAYSACPDEVINETQGRTGDQGYDYLVRALYRCGVCRS
jgi:hypothetical protein